MHMGAKPRLRRCMFVPDLSVPMGYDIRVALPRARKEPEVGGTKRAGGAGATAYSRHVRARMAQDC